MSTRKYTQRRRARQTGETRERILEATMKLHEELGPARTTISAVAREAGVQRLTVYRHFPDEESLFLACTSGWLEEHPLPAARDWERAEDQVQAALLAFYNYYRTTRAMWESSYRDVAVVEALQGPMQAVEAYLDGIARELVGTGAPAFVVLRHALEFSTWKSITRTGLTDAQAASLIQAWIGAVGDGQAFCGP